MSAYVLEIATLLLGLFLLLWEAWTPPHAKARIGYAALAGLALVLVMLFFVKQHEPCDCTFWKLYTDDSIALFYKGLAIVCTMIVIVLGLEYRPVLEKYSARAGGGPAIGEYFSLPVFICTGMMWMASATDITSIFVALELVTIAFYVMVAYMRRNVGSLESGVKYLILGALSTGFFVYGLSWLFGVTGQTNLAEITEALKNTTHTGPALFALALILVGLGFKVAAVPFQMWVPDVYQGAPTPTTAFLSVGSKSAGFVVGYRLLEPFLLSGALSHTTVHIIAVLAGATLLVGNLAAIPQGNFKRLLAYSSISHAGFLLLALAANSHQAPNTSIHVVSFYLGAYLLMTMLCFAVMVVVGRHVGSDDLGAYDGLGKRSPFLAFALLIGVVSLAGVPLTAGFMGKFLVFSLAVTSGNVVLIVLAIIGAVAGFYYYLKVVRSMYFNAPNEAFPCGELTYSPLTKALIILLIAGTLIAGVIPGLISRLLGH